MDRWDGYAGYDELYHSDYYGMYDYYPEDELYHYGVKGQRWGVRRYQNADGSLTDTGRAHYGRGSRRVGGYNTNTTDKKKNVNWRKVAKGAAIGLGAAGALAGGAYLASRAAKSAGRVRLPGTISMGNAGTYFNPKGVNVGFARYRARRAYEKFGSNVSSAADTVKRYAGKAGVGVQNIAGMARAKASQINPRDAVRYAGGNIRTAWNKARTYDYKGAFNSAKNKVYGATFGRRKNVGKGRQLSTNVRSMNWYDRMRAQAKKVNAQQVGVDRTYRMGDYKRKRRR